MNRYERIGRHISNQLDEILRGRPLQAGAGDRFAAAGAGGRGGGVFAAGCRGRRGAPAGEGAGISRGREGVLNLCANNYLGLADHPDVIAAAQEALGRWGYGMASVRFICGTQEPHKELERALSEFLGTEDTILYSSCLDANGGLFETILSADDAVISDELNHASIIDGVRLCKAQRFRYKNNDMADLEAKLKEAAGARFRLIATDGVFSMDGTIANLPAVCDLADRYDALVMVDDSHAAGFIGKHGRGTHEHHDVMGRIDLLTGTLGKALGGGSGGYTSGRKEVIDLLRQRSRPYLFSNSLPPPVVAASLKSLELIRGSTDLRDRLEESTRWFRAANDGGRVQHRPRDAPHHADHARRRRAGGADGRAVARQGRLRDRLLLPGRPAGQGPHPHAGVGRPLAGGLSVRGGGVQVSEARNGRLTRAASRAVGG